MTVLGVLSVPMRASPLLVLTLATLGCGSTVILPPPAADAGTTPADQGIAPNDAPTAADTPTVTDAPALEPLNGRWRLTRYEVDGADGTRRTLTDVDGPIEGATGETTIGRANGVLVVADDRLAASVGTLIMGHFYTYDTGYSANGFAAAGLLDQATGRFSAVGSTMGITLQRNPDGTMVITGDSFGTSRLTFVRAPVTASVDRISTTGLAMIREAMPGGGLTNLRVALFWDLVGAVPDVESNGVAVRFTGRFATYPVVLAGPPPEAVRARVGAATVALARVALYIDQDGSLTFNRAMDRAVAISPVGIAWRDETAGVDMSATPMRDLTPGYQYVHIHPDPGLQRPAVTPDDNANLVSPDLPVILSMSSTPVIPDVL